MRNQSMFSGTNRAVQQKTVSSLKFWKLESIGIIKIYLEFVYKIDNSVTRVTAWHHEALLSDAKQ